MARNTSGLRRGGPGRPKGSKNKDTIAQREWARLLLESDEYRESARRRILSGRASHLETLFHEATVMPRKEELKHSGGIIIRHELPE